MPYFPLRVSSRTPSSASTNTTGFMLGGSEDCSAPDGFATRAASRRGMSKDTAKSLGFRFVT